MPEQQSILITKVASWTLPIVGIPQHMLFFLLGSLVSKYFGILSIQIYFWSLKVWIGKWKGYGVQVGVSRGISGWPGVKICAESGAGPAFQLLINGLDQAYFVVTGPFCCDLTICMKKINKSFSPLID